MIDDTVIKEDKFFFDLPSQPIEKVEQPRRTSYINKRRFMALRCLFCKVTYNIPDTWQTKNAPIRLCNNVTCVGRKSGFATFVFRAFVSQLHPFLLVYDLSPQHVHPLLLFLLLLLLSTSFSSFFGSNRDEG